MKGHTPISDCEVCRRLSSHNYADLMFAPIPENMAALVGTSPTGRPAEDIVECPVCGTFYSYTYTCGFGENDIMLRWVTPTEAGREVDVGVLKRDLASPHDDTRAYAARCLVEHYLSEGMADEAEALLNDDDEIISSNARASKSYHLHRKSLE